MDTEPPRQLLALSAVAGGVFWGMWHLSTTLLAGLPPTRSDVVRAFANVAFAMLAGGLVGYFIAPAVAVLVPLEALREPHALGFGIGAGAWEVAPFALRLLRGRAAAIAREKAE